MIKNIKIYSLFEGFLETLTVDKLNIYERGCHLEGWAYFLLMTILMGDHFLF